MSSMTDAVISEGFKRQVLWDHRIKDYHNRDFVDKEWRNLSQTLNLSSKCYYLAFVFGLYTNYTDMQNRVHVMTLCNDGSELLASMCHGTEPAGGRKIHKIGLAFVWQKR
jgi:hypothetical protein